MSEDFDALSDEVPKACDLDGVGRPLSLEPWTRRSHGITPYYGF